MPPFVDRRPLWSAACDQCEVIVVVDGNGSLIPDPSQADDDAIAYCPFGHGRIYFDSQSETMWNRESRLMNQARSGAYLKAANEIEEHAVPARKDNTSAQRLVGDLLRNIAASLRDKAVA